MNSFDYLLDEFPESVSVDGKDYAVNSDFRAILAVFSVLNDRSFTKTEAVLNALGMFYAESVPENLEEANEKMIEFSLCNDARKIDKAQKETKRHRYKPEIMDYEEDSSYIWSAFMQIYHIDLKETAMHWFEFCALLENIGDVPKLVDVIKIRTMSVPKSASATDRVNIRKLKEEYSLNSNNEDKETLSANESEKNNALMWMTGK